MVAVVPQAVALAQDIPSVEARASLAAISAALHPVLLIAGASANAA
jgi:hypothetical protein